MKHNKALLEEILEDSCQDYCFAKELLFLSPMSDYMIVQLKMIEKFKYDWSAEYHDDVGWQAATEAYTCLYGAKFKKIWDESEGDRHITKLYWTLKKGDA